MLFALGYHLQAQLLVKILTRVIKRKCFSRSVTDKSITGAAAGISQDTYQGQDMDGWKLFMLQSLRRLTVNVPVDLASTRTVTDKSITGAAAGVSQDIYQGQDTAGDGP